MKYLLDTNVVSEFVKSVPNGGLVEWLAGTDESLLYLSVITVGELQKGISKLADPDRAVRLQKWLDQDLSRRFRDRVLPAGTEVWQTWGRMQGDAEKHGSKLPVMDSLIAAIALTYNLTVVTRNVKDMERCQVPVLNPWN